MVVYSIDPSNIVMLQGLGFCDLCPTSPLFHCAEKGRVSFRVSSGFIKRGRIPVEGDGNTNVPGDDPPQFSAEEVHDSRFLGSSILRILLIAGAHPA